MCDGVPFLLPGVDAVEYAAQYLLPTTKDGGKPNNTYSVTSDAPPGSTMSLIVQVGLLLQYLISTSVSTPLLELCPLQHSLWPQL